MASSPTTTDLWHAAQRAARDGRKRLVAALGLVASVAVASAVAWGGRIAAGEGAFAVPFARPLALVLEPLREAWHHDRDLCLLGWVLAHVVAQVLLWGRFGGHLHRLAVLDLAGAPRESSAEVSRFARHRWRAFTGARLAFVLGVVAPLVAVGVLALLGRLPGAWGGLGLAVAAAAGGALALVAVLVLGGGVMGGFLTGPLIAAEGGDAFEAVTGAYGHVLEGLPALLGRRLLFLGGVLLGSGWRLLRTGLVLLLGHAALSQGAPETYDRVLALLGSGGTPPDAARLGLTFGHHVAALTVLAVVAGLMLFWAADLVARVVCARSAVYLLTRRAVEHVPVDRLRAAPRVRAATGAREAGFEEVHRLAGDDA
jgi:hypothetical protein